MTVKSHRHRWPNNAPGVWHQRLLIDLPFQEAVRKEDITQGSEHTPLADARSTMPTTTKKTRTSYRRHRDAQTPLCRFRGNSTPSHPPVGQQLVAVLAKSPSARSGCPCTQSTSTANQTLMFQERKERKAEPCYRTQHTFINASPLLAVSCGPGESTTTVRHFLPHLPLRWLATTGGVLQSLTGKPTKPTTLPQKQGKKEPVISSLEVLLSSSASAADSPTG